MTISKLKQLLSLKQGISTVHMAILALLILGGYFLFSGNNIALFEEPVDYKVTQAVLQALKTQNQDKKLEYDESQPIIKSLEKPLRDFEYNLNKNHTRAMGYLIVIKQRFKYLRYKDLDTSAAEKIVLDAADQANLSLKKE